MSDGAVRDESAGSDRARLALVLAAIAASGTLICTVAGAPLLGPLEQRAASGAPATSDGALLVGYFVLVASNLLWTVFGLLALVFGGIAVAHRRRRRMGAAAILVAGFAPVLSFALWLVLTLLTSPLE